MSRVCNPNCCEVAISSHSKSTACIKCRASRQQALRKAHLFHSMIEEVQEVVKVPARVEEPNWLGMQTQLLPGHHLQQLLQRAKAPGNAYKGIRLCRHLRLHVTHRDLRCDPRSAQ